MTRSTPTALTRRRYGPLVVSAAAALVLAACGGGDTDAADAGPDTGSDTSDPAADGAPASGADQFPVTIPSVLGDAVIEEQPERVVTLGQGSAETAVALGVVPVGVEEYAWGSDETGYLPWLYEAITEAGAELPEQVAGVPELDVDAIVALDPDVVLAPQSGITQEQYDQLSGLVPVVAYPEQAWSTPWDTQMELIGTALGYPEETAALIDEVDQTLADAAAANPEFAEYDFAYLYTGDPGVLGVFQSGEPRVDILTGLGLRLDPVADEQDETEGTNSAVVGLENADLFADTDLVFTFYSSPDNRTEIEGQDLYAQIPAIERGSVVVSEDQSFVTASSLITPLTVPWVLEAYVPMIDEAIGALES